MFKVIIAGSRSFSDYQLLKKTMDNLLVRYHPEVEIVSGRCPIGGDKLGEDYAKERNYTIKPFPAKWDIYKKSAGMVRNKEMADYADALVAFWDGQSPGTKNMIKLAKYKKLHVRVVKYASIL